MWNKKLFQTGQETDQRKLSLTHTHIHTHCQRAMNQNEGKLLISQNILESFCSESVSTQTANKDKTQSKVEITPWCCQILVSYAGSRHFSDILNSKIPLCWFWLDSNLDLYLLSGRSHSRAQQPFHQFFLQHDGIHPKPQTKTATGLGKQRQNPGRYKKQKTKKKTLQIFTGKTLETDVCLCLRALLGSFSRWYHFLFPALLRFLSFLRSFLRPAALRVSLFRQVRRNSHWEGGKCE